MFGPVSPHLMWPSVRSYGTMGLPQSSMRSSADGPSPSPASPWHCAQLNFSYMAAPRSTDLGVYGGSGGMVISGSGFSVAKRGEKFLMYAMTSSLWVWLNVVEKLDMDVPYRPVIKTLSRSASVG